MKKNLLTIVAAMITAVSFAQTPCQNGFAGAYPCDGYDLQSRLTLGDMNAGAGNDSWGWTDPQDGTEYAIMCVDNGTVFVDISTPTNPVIIGKLPTHTSSSSWRDVKTYNNYAFIVSEANGHGMQVFDLTRLRTATPGSTFNNDAHYSGFGSAHNIVINEDSGYAYGVGTGSFNGGAHFINIQNPLNPVAAGGFSQDDYSHDAQVVTYCGPDQDYSGREILIGSNENEISIVDITNKNNPVAISTISYSNVGYTHQGWFTENERYFILGDELDEQNVGFNTKTVIFDFNDLDNPQFHFNYSGPTAAIDHNGYVKGNKYYLANYRSGIRVIDISDIANQNITEEGFFDTYPSSNNANFSGAWNVYPYFASGNIVISDINRGLFIVKAQTTDLIDPVADCVAPITLELDSNGVATITADQLNDNSTDNSGTVNFVTCKTLFDCDDLGDTVVELEVYDDFGNKDYCTTTITVEDNIDPSIVCPADQAETYEATTGFYVLPDYVDNNAVTATDNCSVTSVVQTPAAGEQLTAGSYTIAFVATDAAGNTVNCSFELTLTEVILSANDNELAQGLSIFPNPASNKITIDSKNTNITSLTVTDILGKTLKSLNNISVEKQNIDVSSLSKGVYFVTINNKVTKRIIKK